MFISKKHLSRRTMLRGAGAAIALPLLDAMIPAGTALAQTAAAPSPRLGFFYFPHGAIMDKWTPAATGRDFELTPILQPLAKYKDGMTIVSNLRNTAAEGAGVHATSPGTWLSCASPFTVDLNDPNYGISADQIAAQHLGQDTPFPSIELCTEVKGSSAGACDANLGCGYGSTISFRARTQPLPMEHNPRKLFFRMFGQGDTAQERESIMNQKFSLLDLVAESTASLNGKLGSSDKLRMGEYLDSVRDVERQVEKLGEQDFTGVTIPDAPLGVPGNWEEHINLMFDLAALAYEAQLTRVVSMMISAEISMLTYNQVGISDAYHPLSHHRYVPDKMDKCAVVQTYHSKIFARFLDRLNNTADGDGSMLDHSILLFGSNMSDSNAHNADPLPSAIFGSGYGRIKGGQHLQYAANTPHANLILTILERAGIQGVETLGNSTGLFAEV
ncbi:MAG: DUF1552 domain-containing protein [Pseudomonadales bacterium]|jgi:hypothetical protein|nr:DUF1552 domain-containing protein [Pseudomonadales bacterium]